MNCISNLRTIGTGLLSACAIAALPFEFANASETYEASGKIEKVSYVAYKDWKCEITFRSDTATGSDLINQSRPVSNIKYCKVAEMAKYLDRKIGVTYRNEPKGWGLFYTGIWVSERV